MTCRKRDKSDTKVKGVIGLQFALDRSAHQAVVVEVEEARHLACGDVSAKSDPFVRLLWGERMVGQTNVVMNDQDPIWEEERFVLPVKRSARDKLRKILLDDYAF